MSIRALAICAAMLATGCRESFYIVDSRELAEARASATPHYPAELAAQREGSQLQVRIRSDKIVAEAPHGERTVLVKTRALDVRALSGLGASLAGAGTVALGLYLWTNGLGGNCSALFCSTPLSNFGAVLAGFGLLNAVGGLIYALIAQGREPAEVGPVSW